MDGRVRLPRAHAGQGQAPRESLQRDGLPVKGIQGDLRQVGRDEGGERVGIGADPGVVAGGGQREVRQAAVGFEGGRDGGRRAAAMGGSLVNPDALPRGRGMMTSDKGRRGERRAGGPAEGRVRGDRGAALHVRPPSGSGRDA